MAKYIFELETIDYTPSIVADIKQEVLREREQVAALKQHNRNVSEKLLEVLGVIETDLMKSLAPLGLSLYINRSRVSYQHELQIRSFATYISKPFIRIECPTPNGRYKFEPKIIKGMWTSNGMWSSKGEYKGVEDFLETFRDEIKELYKASLG